MKEVIGFFEKYGFYAVMYIVALVSWGYNMYMHNITAEWLSIAFMFIASLGMRVISGEGKKDDK